MINGYVPTYGEIKNEEIRALAGRLKGRYAKETLTNILDWEGKNLQFWPERYYLQVPFLVLLALTLVMILLVYPIFVSINIPLPNLGILFLIAGLLGAGAATVFSIILIQLVFFYRIPFDELAENILDTAFSIPFRIDLPLDLMFKQRRIICRDYAKLTACLLRNVYPQKDIYFVSTRGHVATGLGVGNNIYILDQVLPILTINGWNGLHHIRKVEKLYGKRQPKVKKVDGKSFLYSIQMSDKKREVLADAFGKKIALNLHLNTSGKHILHTNFKFKKWSKWYENNNIVDYSIERWIRNKLHDELYDLRNSKARGLMAKRNGKESLEFVIFDK